MLTRTTMMRAISRARRCTRHDDALITEAYSSSWPCWSMLRLILHAMRAAPLSSSASASIIDDIRVIDALSEDIA